MSDIKALTLALFHTMTDKISTLLDAQPPPWLVYLTIVISFGTLLIRTFDYLKKRQDREDDHVSSILDEYWFRKVFSPKCVEPLVDFVSTQMDALQFLDSHGISVQFSKYKSDFQSEKDKLIRKFLLFREWNPAIYDLVSEGLDELDDIITFYCAAKELGHPIKDYGTLSYVEGEIYTKFGSLLKAITKEHLRLEERESSPKIPTTLGSEYSFLSHLLHIGKAIRHPPQDAKN